MEYLYSINYDVNFKELCEYEIKLLFGKKLQAKYIISNHDIEVSKCVFIKEKMTILNKADNFFSLITNIFQAHYNIDDFKIVVLNVPGHKLDHKKQLSYMITTSYCIDGVGRIKDPKHVFAITQVNGCWYFGDYEKNAQTYKIQNSRPHSYSNSLPYDVSRSLINIAINDNLQARVVDPCAGACTVLIDGLLQGINIDGYEINEAIGILGQENIDYLGLNYHLNIMDMHSITKKYDVAILDIPYGLFSDTTKEQQQQIICKCHEIASRLLLITSSNMTEMINIANFKINDVINIHKKGKNSFSRILYVCEQI